MRGARTGARVRPGTAKPRSRHYHVTIGYDLGTTEAVVLEQYVVRKIKEAVELVRDWTFDMQDFGADVSASEQSGIAYYTATIGAHPARSLTISEAQRRTCASAQCLARGEPKEEGTSDADER